MIKTAIFTQKIVVYNESFVPVGKKPEELSKFAASWHDAMFGRINDELISTFSNFLMTKRVTKRLTFGKIAALRKTKNWSLFFSVCIINSKEMLASEIVLRYFESGHIFKTPSSGSQDFQDFVTAVKNVSPTTEAFPNGAK